MKLKRCIKCKSYTLKDSCPKCKYKSKDAHYKWVNIKIKSSEQKNL